MAKLIVSVTEIIAELRRIQNATIDTISEAGSFGIPGMIGVGDGNGIIVSRKIDELIWSISRLMKSNDPNLAQRVTDEEWNSIVRKAFGPPLARIDLGGNIEENARCVLKEVKSSVKKGTTQYEAREIAFGCTLFSDNTKIKAFKIGPVSFEPRCSWLEGKLSQGAISRVTYRRICRAWKGERLARRRNSIDFLQEKGILDAVREAPYVCSVLTDGFANRAGFGKALTAARLALSSISLLWQSPAQVLDGLNLTYDRVLFVQRAMTFAPGRVGLAGSRISHSPHGPYLKDGEWERILVRRSDYFRIIGEVLDFVLSPTGSAVRPRMMCALLQSLNWFQEACREAVPLIAIVKFAASMDALSDGHKASGIRNMVTARLGIKDEDQIRPGGPSMKESIENIFNEGRSRTIHGTNTRLGHDWSLMRSLAEQFARMCFVACMDWLAKNPGSDDPSLLRQ